MADARYLIDIILNARDNTAAAFAKAAGQAEAFKRIQEETEQQNKRTADSYEQMARRLNTSQAELNRQMERARQGTKEQLDATVALEQATRSYVKAIGDAKTTEAQRLQALQRLRDAEDALTETLEEQGREDARRTAQAVTNSTRRIEQARAEIQQTTEAARIAERERQEQMRQGEAMAREIEEIGQARHRARMERMNQEAQAERELAEVRNRLAQMEAQQAAEAERARQENFRVREEQRNREVQAERGMAEVREALGRREAEQAAEQERARQENFRAREEQRERELQAEREMAEVREALRRREAEQAAEEERERIERFEARQRQIEQELQAEREMAEVRQRLGQMDAEQAAEEERARIANFEARQAQIKRLLREEEEAARKRAELNRILARSEAEAERRRVQNAERELRDIRRIEAEREAASRREQARMGRELGLQREYVERLQQITRLSREREQAFSRGDTLTVARIDLDARQARAEAAELAAELHALFGRIEANVDIDSGEAQAHAAALLAMKETLGKDVTFNVDVDAGAALAQMAAVEAQSRRLNNELGFMRGLTRSVSEGFHNSSGTIASFDNFLRGLLSLGIAAFFNQLFLLANAAAGALFALASSAAMAGAAIGGSLVAGIAQALGPLGLLVAAAARVAAVMEAVQQANLLEQQQSYQGAEQAMRRASALDQVRGAEERLADTNRRVTDAQRKVNEARQEGIDKLNELILAERGLSLTVEESEAAIRRAAASGDTSALPRAFQRRDEAKADLTATRREIRTREQLGVEHSPEIQQAQEGLRDAQRAAREAERSLKGAQRSSRDAEAGVTSAAGKLNFLLGKLSGAERRLYEAVLRLQGVWRDFAQDVTAPLLNAFTFAINRIIELLGQPRIRNAARSLAETMAGQFRRIFSFLTSDEVIGQIIRIIGQAQRNLRPLTTIAINLGRAFLDIAEAAGPAFREIILWVRDISEGVSRFFREGRKSGDLQQFFREGVKHLKAWGGLLWEVIRLFAALAGPGGGAKTGLALVRDMAETIRGWADAISTPGTRLNEFFQRFFRLSRKMIEAAGVVFGSIAREIDKTFNKDGLNSVQGFASFLADVLIPAIGDFARLLGRVTAGMKDFGKEHPRLAKIATALISASLAFSVFGRAAAILGPILGPLRFLGGQLANMVGLTGRLAAEGTRLAAVFARLRPIVIGPWGLAAAALIYLIGRAGKLDDIFRKIVDTAKEIWRELQPGFKDLQESVRDLIGAFQEGGGLIDVLTFLAGIVADVLMEAINSFGILIQNVGRGVLRVFGGVIDIITAIIKLFSGDFDEAGRLALRGIRKVAQGIWDALWGVLSGIGGFFVRLFRRAINALLDFLGISSPSRKFREIAGQILDGIWEGIKSLPRMLGGVFRSAISRIGDVISNLGSDLASFGKKIIDKIIEGIKSAPGAIKDAVGGIIPSPGDIIDTAGKVLPWNWNKGGAVPGYGGGDTVPSMLEGGEHVFTKEEVSNAGGHGVLFAIRRMLGGGTQGGHRGRYQAGGAVRSGVAPQLGVMFTGNLGDFVAAWGDMWTEAVTLARRGANLIEAQFAQLRTSVGRAMESLFVRFRRTWADIEDTGEARSRRLVRGITRSFEELQTVVYRGLRYVGSTTNSALKAFDSDPIKLSINAPRKAGGGVIDTWGARGKDAILAMVGNGEVVLNWAQQQALNARLRGQETVQSIVEGTQALHAGTYGEQLGFAGGYAGKIPGNGQSVPVPGAPGEFIAKRIAGHVTSLMRRFNAALTDGFATTGHATNSDHYKGLAGDFVPGAGGSWDKIDAMAAYAQTKLGSIFRWIGYDGVAGHGRGNHLHLSWLSDVAGLGGLAMEQIKRITVRGRGALKTLAQRAINVVRNAANQTLSGQMDSGIMEAHPTGKGVLSRGEAMGVINEAMELAGVPLQIRSAWRAMAYDRARQESGFNAHAVNNWDINAKNGDPSRGLFQTIGGTFRAYALPGHGNILNPLDNAVAAFRYMIASYGKGDANAALVAMNARRGIGYDTGGHIDGPEGSPQLILAHAGEWVLNKIQQSKLAQMIGMSSSQLKRSLGFSGTHKSEFQDGGEVTPEQRRLRQIGRGRYEFPAVDPDTLTGLQREITRMFRAIQNMSRRGKLGQQIDRFVRNIRAMTDEGGFLDQLGERIDEIGTRMGTGLELAQVGFRRVGNRLLRRRGGPLTDAVQIAERTVAQYERVGEAIREGRTDARRGIDQTNAQIARLRKGGITRGERDRYRTLIAARERFQTALSDLDSRFADNQANLFQARLDRFKAVTERAMRPSTDRADYLDMWEQMANALGQQGSLAEIGKQQLTNLQSQQKVVADRWRAAAARAARDPRFQAEADELLKQWRDLSAAIVEQQAENLRNQMQSVQDRLANDQRLEGLSERVIGVRERLGGDRLQHNLSRQVLAASRVNSMVVARNQLLALRQQTFATGDQGAFKELTEQIEELNVAIEEENATRRELVYQYRQTASEIITGRAERSTGLIGAASGIIQKLGEMTGAVDFSKIAALLQQSLDQLKIAAGQIASNVRDSIIGNEFGAGGSSILAQLTSAFQQGPGQFASTLAALGPAIAALEATMGETQRAAFQALIQAMLDNTTAVVDNTQQLEDIVNPNTGQSFSTTLWTMFRTAIFNGNGSLLPQYEIPQMHVGGYVTRGGIFDLSVGERVLTTDQQAAGERHEHIHITNPTEVADPDYIFEVAEFKRSTRRAT